MTLLTPNFSEQIKTNGSAGAPLHVLPAHEPLKQELPSAVSGGDGPPSQHTNETCSAAGGGRLAGEGHEAARPLKVALVGTAPSSRMLAPFNDPTWTIWACSPGNMNTLPRVDAWFEIHSNLLWPEYESYGRPYIEWLKGAPFPVYMQDQSLLPKAVVFPMYEIVKEFGDEFFTSSFAWMMALAIHKGATEIALYGIDMASRDEYILQRPGFYHFKREATRRGIKISAPHESDIMQSPPLYGYVDSTPFGRKIRARATEVNGRIAAMEPQHAQLTNNITYLKGAKEDIDYFESIWSGVCNEMSILKHELMLARQEIERLKQPLVPVLQWTPPVIAASFDKPRKQRRKRTPAVTEEFKVYAGAGDLQIAPMENPDA